MPPRHHLVAVRPLMDHGRWQRWQQSLAHAFRVEAGPQDLDPDDLALVDRLATAIARRGLAAPACLFLESLAPLNFLGSQALYAATPLLDLVGAGADADRLAAVLERRGAVAIFRARIEAAAAAPSVPDGSR